MDWKAMALLPGCLCASERVELSLPAGAEATYQLASEHPATNSDPAQLTLTDVNFFTSRSGQNGGVPSRRSTNSFHSCGKEKLTAVKVMPGHDLITDSEYGV